MKAISYICVLLTLFLAGACEHKTDENDSKDIAEEQNDSKFDDTRLEDDVEFAVEAADGGMLEVQLAELAIKNTNVPEVKELAQTIVADHDKANKELEEIASQKNISLPIALSEENQRKYVDLAEKTGTDFDKAYCDFMVKDHKSDINDFKTQVTKGNDADLKIWAAKKVTELEYHLSLAESAQSAVKDN